jgi:DNA-binding response OmpR family regulator
MDKKPLLLLVEDDAIFSHLLCTKLADDYDVIHVPSGDECLARLDEFDPDIVIMDVMMPGTDGYETCRRLKQESRFENVPVIFLSAANSLEDRLAGYEAGGYDYLFKPAVLTELQRKLAILMRVEFKIDGLREQASTAFKTAMSAMSSAAELGIVVQAMRESLSCANHAALAHLLLRTVDQYGLDCSVQVRGRSTVISLSREGGCTPLEASIMSKLAEHGRMVDLGSRTAINFESISVIAKNMPRDDPERYGRLKDGLALLLEGMDTRVRTLDMETRMQSQIEQTTRLMESLGDTLIMLDKGVQGYRQNTVNIMSDLVSTINDAFTRFGLTQAQIDYIHVCTDGAREELEALEKDGVVVDKQLHAALEGLYQILSQANDGVDDGTFF